MRATTRDCSAAIAQSATVGQILGLGWEKPAEGVREIVSTCQLPRRCLCSVCVDLLRL
jgi:hypothetical protein